MICKDCKNKPIVRGIKHIKCFKCGKKAIVNSVYGHICDNCSDTYIICQYCGKGD